MSALRKLLREHAGVLIALCAAGLSLLLLGDFVTDDAAITLRYSRQWVDGHGITWNTGEDPVEGYTNFLHVLIGAAAIRLELPALETLRVIGQVSLGALVLIVYALGLSALGSRRWAAAAATLVGIHPAFGYWASSGLETGLYSVLVYAGVYATLHVRSARNLWPAPLFLLASLARFEGPVVCAIALLPSAVTIVRERRLSALGKHAGWLLAFAVTYGAYFVWRWSYFGYPLSNSAYWKIGAGSGLLLITELAKHTPVLLTLACLADYKRLRGLGLVLATMIVVHIVGAYDMRNSVAYLHRFFLPIVPALALLSASALGRAQELGARIPKLRPLAFALLGLAFVFEIAGPAGFVRARQSADRLNLRARNRVRVAQFLAATVPARAPIAVDDVGFIGYIVPNPVLDVFGLNSEVYVHAFRGEAVDYTQYLMAQRPAAIVLVSSRSNELRPQFGIGSMLLLAARRAHLYGAPEVFSSSTADGYHYHVLVRRDLTKQRPQLHLPIDDRASTRPSIEIDAAFMQVRNALRASHEKR